MSDGARGLILWILAAVGVMFIYSGIKNITVRSLLTSFITPTAPVTPIQTVGATTGTASVITSPADPASTAQIA